MGVLATMAASLALITLLGGAFRTPTHVDTSAQAHRLELAREQSAMEDTMRTAAARTGLDGGDGGRLRTEGEDYGVLPTPWTEKVDVNAPLPEYPRPQMRRERWANLNGVWEFETSSFEAFERSDLPFNRTLGRHIVVPFPVESTLSGIHEHHAGMSHMVYRTNFTVPSAWLRATDPGDEGGRPPPRLLLHFDAVDWEAAVYVDGQLAGKHKGGYDRFSFDIAPLLMQAPTAGDEGSGGERSHELLVTVSDPTEYGHIALGKQRLHPPRHPSSIWYTSCSGIWRTVWMEPVPASYVSSLDLIPDIDDSKLSVTAHVALGGGSPGPDRYSGLVVRATAMLEGKTIAQAEGALGAAFWLPITSPMRLWSPDSPALYDLRVELLAHRPANTNTNINTSNASDKVAVVVDAVDSYFGMRKISLGRLPGEPDPRMMINNKFEFQLGMLDQGYWPDGVYTAPTDEALRSDIEFAKGMGYNMLRKHIKVEPDRWYYWADTLGVLVWQDMPSMFWEDNTPAEEARSPSKPSAEEKAQWEGELARLIKGHLSVPSIVVWVVFNEGWGQYDTERVVSSAMKLDSSRLFDPASGWNDAPVGNLLDMHMYVGPDAPLATQSRAAVLGEFGGLGYLEGGHLWIPTESFCYEMQPSRQALEVRYLGLVAGLKQLIQPPSSPTSSKVLKLGSRLSALLRAAADTGGGGGVGDVGVGVGGKSLSAAVYTELTDVEAEVNGWLTYDRRVVKTADRYAVPAAHRDLLEFARSLGNASAAALAAGGRRGGGMAGQRHAAVEPRHAEQ